MVQDKENMVKDKGTSFHARDEKSLQARIDQAMLATGWSDNATNYPSLFACCLHFFVHYPSFFVHYPNFPAKVDLGLHGQTWRGRR